MCLHSAFLLIYWLLELPQTHSQNRFQEAYQFGDITQAIFSGGSKRLNNIFVTWTPPSDAHVTEEPAGAAAKSPPVITSDDIWGSFFRQSEMVLVEALRGGLVGLDDVDDIEPSLLLGLPGLTLLETCLRSRRLPGLQLSCGIEVNDRTIPDDMAELYHALVHIKANLEELNLTESEEHYLRHRVLSVGKEEEERLQALTLAPDPY